MHVIIKLLFSFMLITRKILEVSTLHQIMKVGLDTYIAQAKVSSVVPLLITGDQRGSLGDFT